MVGTLHPKYHKTAFDSSQIKKHLFYFNVKILFNGIESEKSGQLNYVFSK